MLSGIKEKLLNVKKNVNLFNNNEEKTVKCNESVNVYAGADILSKYQEDWVAIHDTNVKNAEVAEKIASDIQTVSNKVKHDHKNIDLIIHILSQSNLKTNITNCLGQIKTLYSSCENVEKSLLELEDLIDEINFENVKKQHAYHLEQYKIRKKDSLVEVENTLKENYNKKLAEFEISKQKLLEERQKVFQEAFKSDLEVYKNLGTIPKVELPKKQQGALLEEIQLDFDQNELDQFFGENSNQ